MKTNRVKIALALAILILSPGIGTAQTKSDSSYIQNRNYTNQTALYDIYRTEKADIVMLGNSITFGVNWNELMGRASIVNRGIGSDNTYGFLQRMEYVYKLHPKVCCVMGGINDIYQETPAEHVFENYKKILDGLRAHNIIPIIQSTLFVSTKWKRYVEKNAEVARLDSMLAQYATNNNIDFIDLNAVMSQNNLLKEELTLDGVHLTPKGYALWRNELEKALRKYAL